MTNNYDSVNAFSHKTSTHLKSQENKAHSATKRTWLSFVTIFVALFSFVFAQGQTTLISPTGDGGFENGSTFAANGWTAVNAATDGWAVGAAPVASAGTNCGYVSTNGGTAWDYSQFLTFTHIYKDVTIPAGENVLTLKFKWKATGEGTTTSDWDNMKVFIAPTTVTPINTAAVTGATQLSGPGAISGMYKLSSASWNSETIVLSGTAGTTVRLIFSWKSDGTVIANPPAALDEISLTSKAPGTFISVATGNWNTPSTWDASAVPSAFDNATVSATHTVTADIATTSIANLTVDGTLAYATACTNIAVGGNLTVNSGGLINVFFTTTGKTLTVKGNISNNGRIDTSVGAATAGTLTLNGTTVQTVSGTGTFGGTVTSTTTTNTAGVIRNLIINNTNTTIPNIVWSFNNIKIAYNLTFTNAKVNLGTNKLTFGNFAAGNTLTATAPNGILAGGKFSRWWTAAATGTSFTAGTDPTNTTSRYPFINSIGLNRAMYITRTSATGAVEGELAVVYTDATTNTSGLSIADGAYTITDRYNGNWMVSNEGTAVSATSYSVALIAPVTLYPTNGNARVMGASAAISGTHQNGTATPGAQRTLVTQADLLAGPLYIGIAAADIPFVSIANGNWNATTTWNKGTLPTCNDIVTIAAGNTVTVNSDTNVSKGIIITAGATLTVASGDITVGCTLSNNTLTNNGTLTVSDGVLNINGNLMNNAGSTFNQSGGEINVDGNDGVTANSVATGTPLVRVTASGVANLNLTGGLLTIVDPHKGASTSDFALSVSQAGASNAASPNHTVRFGDGASAIDGGHSNGFYVYLFPGSFYYSLGNVTVDALTGVNRFVKTNLTVGILGNLNIISGEYQLASSNIISGNVINNGTLTATALLALGTWTNSLYTPSTNPQSISGTGVFQNLATSSTANLTSFQVFNTNATGVTLNVPLSLSGTLTMSSGIINTTNTNLLSLGTATAAGTLAGTQSATNMIKGPFARTIASANANTNYILFPVGKTAYAPISIAPATTAVTVIKAETFDTNTGTQNAAITNMSTTRRWEAPIVSGTVTNLNVLLGDAGILATSIPVQGPTAAGEYTNAFGSVATAVAGATTQSNTVVTGANYTGFLSYAASNACSGTPAPGNTVATATTICLGTSITLSLQNVTSGSGVTYQWKSSTDGITYAAITDATNATYTTTPTASTYYLCDVTCSTGPSTGTSTAVQITFPNSITATTPGTRCGTGTVSLGATPSAGATVKWYAAAIGGTALATGATYTTPSITATTTYYAGAETSTAGNLTVGTGTTLTGATSQNSLFCNYWYQGWRQFVYTAQELIQLGLGAGNITSLTFNTTTLPSPATINNFAVRMGSTTNGTLTSFQTTGLAVTYGPSNYTPVVGSNTITLATPYSWDGVSNIIIDIREDGQYGDANSVTLVTTTPTNTVLHAYSFTNNSAFYTSAPSATASNTRPNIVFSGQVACSSSRLPVVATVTTPPALTLSGAAATICEASASSTVTLTSTAADYNTFVWTPTTGVSGDEIAGWVFNPSVSTSYTLTATQTGGNLCSSTATYAVTVNPRPSVMTIAPVTGSACVNSVQSLGTNGGTISFSGEGQVGTATTLTAATSQPTAFCNRFTHYWVQMVYTAAELTAAGVQAGNISALRFKTGAQGSANNVTDFKVRLGNTTSSTLTGFTTSGLTQVFSVASYNTVVGVNTITFDTPYVWDGTSNVIVDMRQTGVDLSNNSTTEYTPTTGNTVVYAITSSTITGGSDGFANSAPSATTSVNRLNTTLLFNSSVPTTITWSPVTNLYTDAAATTAYVANANASMVYFKSAAAAAATTYTATATTLLGCSRTATVDVTVNPLPTVVTVAPAAVCVGSTVDLTVASVTTGSDTGLTYTYFTDMAATTALTTPTAVSASNTYYIKGTNTNGCSAVASVVVTVNPLPTVVAVAPATVCFPSTVDLTAAAVTTGSASGLSYTYFTDMAATASYATPAAAIAGTYYIKGTNANGCSSIASVIVSVNQPAAPTGNATASFCGSANMTNLSAVGTGIKWYDAATAGNQIPVLSVVGLTNGATYYASQTVSGCESVNRLPIVVTITSIPSAPNAAAQTFCNSGTIADLAPAGSGLQWYATATSVTALATTATLAAGTYFVSQTNNTCEGPRTSVAVTVNVTPAPTAIAQTFCGSVTVANLVATGTAVKWYATATSVTALATTATLATGTYFASQTLNGCEGPRTEVAVTVNVTPAPTASAQSFCGSGTVADLVATGTAVKWYATATSVTALATTEALSTTNYFASQTLNGCEGPRTSVAVTVSVIAAPSGSASQDSCSGNIAAFVVTGATGATFNWYASNTATSTIPTTTTAVLNTVYYVSQTVNGCEGPRFAVTASGPCLGKETFDIANFNYYPNPTSDVLNISYSDEITQVRVFNMIGQEVIIRKVNATSTQVDLSQFASGTYFVEVTSDQVSKTVKVVKK